MKTIELTQGLVAIIDDIDFEEIALKKWCAVKNRNVWYAVNGKGEKKMFMHRLILRATKGQKVDHRDGNGLNNQRANIRLASASQNGANRQVLSKKVRNILAFIRLKKNIRLVAERMAIYIDHNFLKMKNKQLKPTMILRNNYMVLLQS
jgi:hypothetical protein